MSDNNNQDTKANLSFLEHLEILRKHIIRALISVVIFALLAFFFKQIIFDYIILAPKSPEFITNKLLCIFGMKYNIPDLCLNSEFFEIINIKMSGQFAIHIQISMYAGIIIASPYIFF